MTEYRTIPGYKDYTISDDGEVVSHYGSKHHVLKPHHVRGYLKIQLHHSNGKDIRFVHRLVMLAFVGEPPIEQPQVNHKNGIRDDNRLENLEYCSPMENTHHAIEVLGFDTVENARRGGYAVRGEVNGSTRLTQAKVQQIRELLNQGVYQYEIARIFEISQATVSRISRRASWGWLD